MGFQLQLKSARFMERMLIRGGIEPHEKLLEQPVNEQLLFKVMSAENFVASVADSYMHFNRVDRYKDFPIADARDGEQLPADRPSNEAATFAKAPGFSLADYYDTARARTYACSFSLENTPLIWRDYGLGGSHGKVCLVLEFGRLRTTLNKTLDSATGRLLFDGVICEQIFNVNYGLVDYVDWASLRMNQARYVNPVQYTYLKDRKRFADEKELRISLSALGIGSYKVSGKGLDFYDFVHIDFDYRSAMANGTMRTVECSPDIDRAYLQSRLEELRIEVGFR